MALVYITTGKEIKFCQIKITSTTLAKKLALNPKGGITTNHIKLLRVLEANSIANLLN